MDEAARAVRQLGTLLFEMEILRTYLEQQDLQFFDSILEPAKTTAFIAVQGLVGEYYNILAAWQSWVLCFGLLLMGDVWGSTFFIE